MTPLADLASLSVAPLRVLITNDHEWTLRSLESVLATLPVEISRAFTCAQARAHLERAPHDLVFLDTNLPDGDGVELARRLRDERLVPRDVPVIMTTSGPLSRNDRLRAHEAGAWDYLAEPFDGPVLLARLAVLAEARLAARDRTGDPAAA